MGGEGFILLELESLEGCRSTQRRCERREKRREGILGDGGASTSNDGNDPEQSLQTDLCVGRA